MNICEQEFHAEKQNPRCKIDFEDVSGEKQIVRRSVFVDIEKLWQDQRGKLWFEEVWSDREECWSCSGDLRAEDIV